MNKLEEQLFEAFNNPVAYSLHGKPGFALEEHYARIAAKIALELAERAYNQGVYDGFYQAQLIYNSLNKRYYE